MSVIDEFQYETGMRREPGRPQLDAEQREARHGLIEARDAVRQRLSVIAEGNFLTPEMIELCDRASPKRIGPDTSE